MDEVKVVRIVAEKYCLPDEHKEHIRMLEEKGFTVEAKEVVWVFSEDGDTHNQVPAVQRLRARV